MVDPSLVPDREKHLWGFVGNLWEPMGTHGNLRAHLGKPPLRAFKAGGGRRISSRLRGREAMPRRGAPASAWAAEG